MKFLSLLFSLNSLAFGAKRPPTPSPTPSNTPSPQTGSVDAIFKLASESKCASYAWKNRGVAPPAYVKGMALGFARAVCMLEAGWQPTMDTAQKDRNNLNYDALTVYAPRFKALGIKTDTSGVDTLRAVYLLGMGLGMRESSGKYCTGRDMSAGFSSSDTAETGLFQFSMNSISAWGGLKNIYSKYQADPSQCALEVFSKNVSCSSGDAKNWGTGAGFEFQKFTKACPAFAAEYAMLLIRSLRKHFGPLNREEAELEPSCNDMLKKVQDMATNNPKLCEAL